MTTLSTIGSAFGLGAGAGLGAGVGAGVGAGLGAGAAQAAITDTTANTKIRQMLPTNVTDLFFFISFLRYFNTNPQLTAAHFIISHLLVFLNLKRSYSSAISYLKTHTLASGG